MHTFNHRDGQHLDIDGARIYVEEQGNPGGPALLFLPGGFLIASGNGLAHLLDGGTQARTQAAVVGVQLDCLASTFARRRDVCHGAVSSRSPRALVDNGNDCGPPGCVCSRSGNTARKLSLSL